MTQHVLIFVSQIMHCDYRKTSNKCTRYKHWPRAPCIYYFVPGYVKFTLCVNSQHLYIELLAGPLAV